MQVLGGVTGVLVLALVVRHVGWRQVTEALGRVGFGLLWMPLIYGVANVLMALPFHLFLPREKRPPVAGAICSRLTAAGLNAILPFAALGEASRLLWLNRTQWPEGIAAMVVDRMLFLVASALAVSAGAAALLFVPGAPSWLAAGGISLATVVLVGVAVVGFLIVRRPPIAWARAMLARIRGKVAGVPAPEPVDEALRKLLAGPKRQLWLALALHVTGRALITLEVYVACRLLGVSAGLPDVLVLTAVPLALSVLAAAVPSQIGVQEGAQAAVAAILGLGATAGVLVVLLQRARQILYLPITFVLLATRPHRAPTSAPPHIDVAPQLPS